MHKHYPRHFSSGWPQLQGYMEMGLAGYRPLIGLQTSPALRGISLAILIGHLECCWGGLQPISPAGEVLKDGPVSFPYINLGYPVDGVWI